VLVDSAPVRSCITPVSEVGTRAVTTLESLGTLEKPHPIHRAFITEQATLCG
jgi:nicotinate dehydrogenase subunit A